VSPENKNHRSRNFSTRILKRRFRIYIRFWLKANFRSAAGHWQLSCWKAIPKSPPEWKKSIRVYPNRFNSIWTNFAIILPGKRFG